MRIVQISDTHISHLGGTPSDNMSLLIDHVNNELRPDLVVHTGDVVIANPDSAQDHEAASTLIQRIDAPVRVLPGNHDVGESADNPWMDLPVTSDRIAAFTQTWGQDRFFLTGSSATRSAGWVFIGLNSERFSSGLPEEGEQWAWLADAAEQARDKSVMLFLHKPLWYPDAWPGVIVAPADRDRLLSLFAGTRLRAVANGHVHQHRRSFEGEILTVWAPSLAFALPADPERGLAPSEPAIVEYIIDGDAIEAHRHAVPGLGRVDNAMEMPEMRAAIAEIKTRMTRVMVEVTAKMVEPTPTAVVKAATTWPEFPATWGPMLDQVWSFLRGAAPEGLYQHGHNIMLYKDDVPNVEVGVQVTGPFDPADQVVPSTLPGGLVATATHTGPIAKIGDTHQQICEWSEENGYRLTGQRWEIYGDPDPSTGHFDVAVFWSLVAP